MRFIDIAANLTDAVYSGVYHGSARHVADLPTVLSRASSAGVVRTMVTAGTLDQSREALSLSRSHETLFSTVGVHPTRAGEFGSDANVAAHIDSLRDVLRDGAGHVVAVGECGLDYDRLQFCEKEEQMRGFVAQFQLAEESGLPMFLHDRNTGGDFGRVVRANRERFSTGVVHSFTGQLDEMLNYVNMDLYIGVNGCSLKTEENLQVVAQIPLDRLMLETDCPYCEIRNTHAGSHHVKSKWPAKDKKKYSAEAMVKGRNEPCRIVDVCEVVAAMRGDSVQVVADAAYDNTMRVFFPGQSDPPEAASSDQS